jgi:hypothetical protein
VQALRKEKDVGQWNEIQGTVGSEKENRLWEKFINRKRTGITGE